MLHLKPSKKIKIHLSISFTEPQHPWDILAEKAKAKQLEQQQRAEHHPSSEKNYQKGPFSFKETPGQGSQILINSQETDLAENEQDPMQMLDEPAEGFFLCPSCTCWFTNQKDLNYHKKHWCTR